MLIIPEKLLIPPVTYACFNIFDSIKLEAIFIPAIHCNDKPYSVVDIDHISQLKWSGNK